MNAQIPLFDDGIGPHAGDQIFPADGFVGALGQRDQDIQCTASDADRLAILQKQLLRWKQPKWPERNPMVGRSGRVIRHCSSPKDSVRTLGASIGTVQPRARAKNHCSSEPYCPSTVASPMDLR